MVPVSKSSGRGSAEQLGRCLCLALVEQMLCPTVAAGSSLGIAGKEDLHGRRRGQRLRGQLPLDVVQHQRAFGGQHLGLSGSLPQAPQPTGDLARRQAQHIGRKSVGPRQRCDFCLHQPKQPQRLDAARVVAQLGLG